MPQRSARYRNDRPFLDIVSYGRRAPSERQLRLLPAQIEQITRTVRHAPEVMFKISGGGQRAVGVSVPPDVRARLRGASPSSAPPCDA